MVRGRDSTAGVPEEVPSPAIGEDCIRTCWVSGGEVIVGGAQGVDGGSDDKAIWTREHPAIRKSAHLANGQLADRSRALIIVPISSRTVRQIAR
jgi:hypothetical protein